MGRGRVDDQKNKLFLSRIIHINIHFCGINDFSYMIQKVDFQLTNSNIIQLHHRNKLRQSLLHPEAHRTRTFLFQSPLPLTFFFGSVYRHNGSADYFLAIRTTVVPIILAIRTAVVPIIFANRTTVDRTMHGRKKIQTGT